MSEQIENLIGDLQELVSKEKRFNALVAHIFDEHLLAKHDPEKRREAHVLGDLLDFIKSNNG